MSDDSSVNVPFRIHPKGLQNSLQKSRFGQSEFPGIVFYHDPPSLDVLRHSADPRAGNDDTTFAWLRSTCGSGESLQGNLNSPLPIGDRWTEAPPGPCNHFNKNRGDGFSVRICCRYQYPFCYSPDPGPQWKSPFQQLVQHDLNPTEWSRLWPKGTKRLSLHCIPRFLSQSDLLQYLRDSFRISLQPPTIVNLVLLFGDETTCLNPLSPDSSSHDLYYSSRPNGPVCFAYPSIQVKAQATAALSGLALASCEFETEDDAQLFWSWSSAGRIKLYGHTITSTPDPSGFRVFGEAVAANFRQEDLSSAKMSVCYCCSDSPPSSGVWPPPPAPVQNQSKIFLPFVSRHFANTVLKPLPFFTKHRVHVQWSDTLSGALITFPSDAHRDICRLPQKYTFKAMDGVGTVKASLFRLGSRVTPCILENECPYQLSKKEMITKSEPEQFPSPATDELPAGETQSLTSPSSGEDRVSRAKRAREDIELNDKRKVGIVASKKKARTPQKRSWEESVEETQPLNLSHGPTTVRTLTGEYTASPGRCIKKISKASGMSSASTRLTRTPDTQLKGLLSNRDLAETTEQLRPTPQQTKNSLERKPLQSKDISWRNGEIETQEQHPSNTIQSGSRVPKRFFLNGENELRRKKRKPIEPMTGRPSTSGDGELPRRPTTRSASGGTQTSFTESIAYVGVSGPAMISTTLEVATPTRPIPPPPPPPPEEPPLLGYQAYPLHTQQPQTPRRSRGRPPRGRGRKRIDDS